MFPSPLAIAIIMVSSFVLTSMFFGRYFGRFLTGFFFVRRTGAWGIMTFVSDDRTFFGETRAVFYFMAMFILDYSYAYTTTTAGESARIDLLLIRCITGFRIYDRS